MTIRRSIVAAVGAGLAFLPVAALAHAHLDHASPAVGSTVAQPPKDVFLWFTEALEAKFSTMRCATLKAGPCKQDPPRLPATTPRNSAYRSRHCRPAPTR